MRLALLYSPPPEHCGEDDRDALTQLRAVADAAQALGHEAVSVPFTLNLTAVRQQLAEVRPDVVFNLCEGAEGRGRFIHFAPALLEEMGLPFTGAGSTAMALSSNKLMAKVVMRAAGLPTPAWRSLRQLESGTRDVQGRFIIKSAWEHASAGLEADCVVQVGGRKALRDAVRRFCTRLGGECLAERYLDGHEYCVALLDSPDGPEVLPAARMCFEEQVGTVRIIGYRAKWDVSSSEYVTVRRDFDVCQRCPSLNADLRTTALACWRAFGLSGYARIDFRTNTRGELNIIDVNANPCLSPDAGYAAALERAGIAYTDAIARILAATSVAGKASALEAIQ
ncbi:D-alanine--D-alanine ligase [Desulfobaculum sp. SPO524]|uniref:D-alanine--D-alanine ligase family protein n=1 Tax=Desulfobaculum sp. SPO524 TaxID=3378071 RepID=UPI00385487B5